MKEKSNLFAYQLFLINYKNFIFELLSDNIEYVFLLYIQNKALYLKILSNFKFDFTKDFIYSTFIYRYYVFTILFSKFFYKD
jgi:hypothetical protein